MKKPTLKELRAKATKLIRKEQWAWRSCGACNGAHKDLMGLINCFECGRWWMDGVDITEKK